MLQTICFIEPLTRILLSVCTYPVPSKYKTFSLTFENFWQKHWWGEGNAFFTQVFSFLPYLSLYKTQLNYLLGNWSFKLVWPAQLPQWHDSAYFWPWRKDHRSSPCSGKGNNSLENLAPSKTARLNENIPLHAYFWTAEIFLMFPAQRNLLSPFDHLILCWGLFHRTYIRDLLCFSYSTEYVPREMLLYVSDIWHSTFLHRD